MYYRSVLLVKETPPKYLEKTTNLPRITNYLMKLYQVHLALGEQHINEPYW